MKLGGTTFMTSFTVYNCKGLFFLGNAPGSTADAKDVSGSHFFRQEEEEHEKESGKKLRSESH